VIVIEFQGPESLCSCDATKKMRARNDWQIIEVVVKAVMKRLLILTALLALTASAATESYTLILVTQAEYLESQLVTFTNLRECTDEGAERLFEQDIYIGFGCEFKEGSEHNPKEGSKNDPLVLPTNAASAQENPSEKNVVQPPEPYVLTLFPQFLEGVDAFDTRDACIERGIKFMATADIFTGFVCDHGRAWQKQDNR